MFIAMGVQGALPSWLVIAVVSRDILIVLAVVLAWFLGHPMQIQPAAISKANTAAQIVLAATVLADGGFGLGLDKLRLVLIWVTAALTFVSLANYIRAWLRHMTGYESGGVGV
jgi:cardiolipin synthase